RSSELAQVAFGQGCRSLWQHLLVSKLRVHDLNVDGLRLGVVLLRGFYTLDDEFRKGLPFARHVHTVDEHRLALSQGFRRTQSVRHILALVENRARPELLEFEAGQHPTLLNLLLGGFLKRPLLQFGLLLDGLADNIRLQELNSRHLWVRIPSGSCGLGTIPVELFHELTLLLRKPRHYWEVFPIATTLVSHPGLWTIVAILRLLTHRATSSHCLAHVIRRRRLSFKMRVCSTSRQTRNISSKQDVSPSGVQWGISGSSIGLGSGVRAEPWVVEQLVSEIPNSARVVASADSFQMSLSLLTKCPHKVCGEL